MEEVDFRPEERYLLNYPQTLIRTLDRVYRAYEEGNVANAHNILLALMNQLYTINHPEIKEIIDHVDMAEAEFQTLANIILASQRGGAMVRAYKDALAEGQAIFDMVRLRIVGLMFRRFGLDNIRNAGPPSNLGKWEPIETRLKRAMDKVWLLGGSDDKKEQYIRVAGRVLAELKAAFEVSLRRR